MGFGGDEAESDHPGWVESWQQREPNREGESDPGWAAEPAVLWHAYGREGLVTLRHG